MVESIFQATSLHDNLVQDEDAELLEVQSEEKLNTQEEIKKRIIDKKENAHVQRVI